MLLKTHVVPAPGKTRVFNYLAKTFLFLSILSFIGLEAPAPQVVMELRCDEGTGTTTLDASGNGYNGVLTNGPTWGAGKYGQGINLDGTNDYVNIADNANFTLTPTVSYSWSGWVKNSNFNQWGTIWSQTINSSNFFYFYAHTSADPEAGPVTNGVSVYWYNGSNKLVIHSNNNVLTSGQWSYIAVTYNASAAQNLRFTIYVNGADVTNRTDVVSSGTLAAIDPTNIRIGSNQPYGEYLNGSVDEIRYYRRLLSVAEIQSDMVIGNAVDTQVPAVNITAPIAGNVSGTTNVTANASDNIGVSGVQFLLDGVNIGAEDITAPYSVSWNTATATNGSHSLTARARDAAGNIATSAAVAVNINNTDAVLPAVNITAPIAGNVSGTISVTANATDNVGVAGVQFLLDGVNIGAEDIAAPYSVSWNTATATNGSHSLTARARDAAGNITTSAAIAVSVNNIDAVFPMVNITAPVAGNVSATINVTANASDNAGIAGVQFLLDGAVLGAEDIAAPYSVSWNTLTATNGSHSLTARARDAAGNTTTSLAVAVTVNNDIEGPTVTVTPPATSPVAGAITLSATASDNTGVAGVQFLLNGANLGTEDVTAPYSVSWNTTGVANGTYTITARARDAAGNNSTSAAIPVTVLNNNLVAAYGFNENTGTTATDNSGNNNTGTLTNGPAWSASGRYGAAILFDGANDFVNINDANSLDLTNGMTLEAWVNPSVLTGFKTIICKDRTTSNYAYTLSANNNTTTVANQRPVSRTRINNTNRTVTGTSKLPLNTWTHVASTYDGATFRLYVNGVQVSSLATTGNITVTTDPLRIGGTTALNAQYFTGLIDEVRIYSKALTQSEIQTDMNTPIAPDVTNPTVSITAPAAGNVSGTINVTANANDNIGVSGVQFLVDGINVGAEDAAAPYSVSWNTTTATNGTHTLTARARDAAGNITTSSGIVVTVNNDTEQPTINLTAPAAGTIAGTVNISADASDNTGVAGVQFLLNGNSVGTEDLAAPYSIAWNTATVTDGNYILTARARDGAGNTTTSSPVIVNILNHPPDTESPTITITAPAAGEVAGTINVTANANDNVAVVGIQFLLDGVNLGAEDAAAPYSVSWNTTTAINGTHTLTAAARDAAGNSTALQVVVTVNNPPDTESPAVSITSPIAGNVSGTINVSANANDNVGVVGVQFLLDGNNLGTEDITSPYSLSWNTTTATTGSHIVTARARDAAGNTATAAGINITVVISNPPAISGISVSSITDNSVVINWTTNVPANSQVSYGTTTAYGLSTLVDATLVSSHSQIINSLAPGALYHYQIRSGDVNGTVAISADNSFTSANLSSSLGTLNGHTVLAFPAGKIIPWTQNPSYGYDSVMKLAWNYLLNSVPNDPATGKPAYYSRSYLNPNTQEVVDWPHNPAGLYGMLVESALKYYGYSGNANVMQLAVDVSLWHLDHGMTTSTDNWASVPYSEGQAGSLNYGGAPQDGVGYLEPDKIGELGYAWLQLYKYNGNTRFRDAAIQAANVLSSKVRVGTVNQSPWPFRVKASNGSVLENYCSNIIGPVSLLDGLIAAGLGNTASYQTARTTAWNWMMTYPMQNNVWAQYFEDVGIQGNYNNNLNQYNANMVARYLLEHPEFDPNWETHSRGIISWVENVFGQTQFGSTIIKEQVPVFPYVMGSHTSRYASVNALLYEKTGDLVAKEKAYRSFNWATYMARSNGVVIDGPDVNNQWFTDGYGDYIRHFMTGLAAVPEWVPSNQTHLLRSSSVVKNISYGTNSVNYTTYDGNAVDVLHVNFNPVTVTANGVALLQRSDLSQPGWTFDAATKALRIYHANATQIFISSVAALNRMGVIDQLYTDNGNRKVFEYTGTCSDYMMYGLRFGHGYSGAVTHFYNPDRGSVNRVNEFMWTAPNPLIVFKKKENETDYTTLNR